MSDIERAIQLLNDESVALCFNDDCVTMNEKGIKPLILLIESGRDFSEYSAADKIIGKAAAFLFVKLRVKAVYGRVMSRGAMEVFEKYAIPYSYSTFTETIINRKGSGVCPMEEAVSDAVDPNDAYKKVQKKLSELQIREERQ